MSKMRLQLVDMAFAKLDKSGDGVVTIDDLKGVYNVKQHPEYLNGNKTESQLLQDFLKKFEEGTPDGKVCIRFLPAMCSVLIFPFTTVDPRGISRLLLGRECLCRRRHVL